MSRYRRLVLTICTITVCVSAGAHQQRAGAAVVHGTGFDATVAGWTSWYGSYQLAGVGQVWCIDHGLRAPDTALGYRPTAPPALPDDLRAAMAWAIGTYGTNPNQIDAAALMLVLHELNNARYPFGQLRIETAALGGFDGHEETLRARAVAIRRDALAHQHLRGPVSLSIEMPSRVTPGAATKATVTVRDARGTPIGGQRLTLQASGGTLDRSEITTGPDGHAIAMVTTWGSATVTADGTIVDPSLQVLGPSGAPAQRVAVPAVLPLHAQTDTRVARGRLQIRKTGDAAPVFGVGGTVFRVTSSRASADFSPVEVRVDPDGTTPTLDLPVGRYLVEETAPAPGYRSAGPWSVDIAPDKTRVLAVENQVARSTLRLVKIDATTGQPLPGAVLVLSADTNGDGHFTQIGEPHLTTTSPIELSGLLPGTYLVTEQSAPAGYERFEPRKIELTPGTSTEIILADPPTPTTTTTTIPVTTMPTTTTTPTSTSSPVTTTTSTPSPSTSTPSPSTSATPHTPPTTGPIPPTRAPMLPRSGASFGPLSLLGSGALSAGAGVALLANDQRRRRRAESTHGDGR